MLETTWFILWGVLWAVYFVLDGYDLGIGTLTPFLAKTDAEQRTMLHAEGPFWDGNEVWLLTAGGVTFAAFPGAYAVMFSSLYAALLLLLFSLILRAVSFEFRGKVASTAWRKTWDFFHFLGSALPAILLGVAFANIFRGIPIDAQGVNQGGLLDLLNIYGLAGGLLFLIAFSMHGALWLAVKTQGEMFDRAMSTAKMLWPGLLVMAVMFLAMTAVYTKLYVNYLANPVLMAIPLVAVVGLLLVRVFIAKGSALASFGASALTLVGVTMFGVVGLYPKLLPSSLNPDWSMTTANAASSPLTLKIMLVVALIFVPIVLAYQAWSHLRFGHKIGEQDLAEEEYF